MNTRGTHRQFGTALNIGFDTTATIGMRSLPQLMDMLASAQHTEPNASGDTGYDTTRNARNGMRAPPVPQPIRDKTTNICMYACICIPTAVCDGGADRTLSTK